MGLPLDIEHPTRGARRSSKSDFRLRTLVAIAAIIAVAAAMRAPERTAMRAAALALRGVMCGSCPILLEARRAPGPGGQHFETNLTQALATLRSGDSRVNAAAPALATNVAGDPSRRSQVKMSHE